MSLLSDHGHLLRWVLPQWSARLERASHLPNVANHSPTMHSHQSLYSSRPPKLSPPQLQWFPQLTHLRIIRAHSSKPWPVAKTRRFYQALYRQLSQVDTLAPKRP